MLLGVCDLFSRMLSRHGYTRENLKASNIPSNSYSICIHLVSALVSGWAIFLAGVPKKPQCLPRKLLECGHARKTKQNQGGGYMAGLTTY